MSVDSLTEIQKDALKEIINIGVGRAAKVLNQMTSHHVELAVPELAVGGPESGIHELFPSQDKCSTVSLGFSGSLAGSAALVFPHQSASNLVTLIVGEEPIMDMDSLRIGTLLEIGNIVLNSVIGSMGNMLAQHIEFVPPDFFEEAVGETFDFCQGKMIILIKTHFIIENQLVEGDIMIIFNIDTFGTLLSAIDELTA